MLKTALLGKFKRRDDGQAFGEWALRNSICWNGPGGGLVEEVKVKDTKAEWYLGSLWIERSFERLDSPGVADAVVIDAT